MFTTTSAMQRMEAPPTPPPSDQGSDAVADQDSNNSTLAGIYDAYRSDSANQTGSSGGVTTGGEEDAGAGGAKTASQTLTDPRSSIYGMYQHSSVGNAPGDFSNSRLSEGDASDAPRTSLVVQRSFYSVGALQMSEQPSGDRHRR